MKKKPTTRDGPRTVNRKVTSATARGRSQQQLRAAREVNAYEEGYENGRKRERAQRKYDETAQALADMPRIPGSPDAVVEMYTLAPDAPPALKPQAERDAAGGSYSRDELTRPDLTGTEPKPWNCRCGVANNSAIVEECPICHTLRPFDYTPPVAENAPFVQPVRPDWPQPGEDPDEYAKRMDQARGRELPEQGSEVTPGTVVRPAPGYYCPIEFAGPVGSVSVDPALVQQLVDLTNTAAKTGAVRSVTLGVKSPQQARLVLRVDFDLGEARVRTVRDE